MFNEYRRQFVVARQSVSPGNGWRVREIGQGWVLSYHEDLPLAVDQAAGPVPDMVLGDLYCRDAATGDGAGRYVRLLWPHVLTDPAALLSVYYAGTGADLVVASSPALAALALAGEAREPDIRDPLTHRAMVNYVPMPGSRYNGVRRLFPDQRIDLARGVVEHRDWRLAPLPSFAAAQEAMTEELCRFAAELGRRIPGTVYLPLTAGMDSRTVAAAFLASGLRFEAVTTRFPGKPETDIVVAGQISRRFGLKHHVIDLEPLDAARGARLARHVGGAFDDWDISHLFPGNAYRYQKRGDAMIVAGCFEIGWPTNHAGLFGDLDFATATGADLWLTGRGRPEGLGFARFLDEWLAWRRRHPRGIGWISEFYLDQRLAGWRAALEHGYDLLPAVPLHPANNVRVFSALLTPTLEERKEGALQRAVIETLIPEFGRFPINPVSLGEKARRVRYRLRSGLVRRLKPLLGT